MDQRDVAAIRWTTVCPECHWVVYARAEATERCACGAVAINEHVGHLTLEVAPSIWRQISLTRTTLPASEADLIWDYLNGRMVYGPHPERRP
jgi:hypothetical protein